MKPDGGFVSAGFAEGGHTAPRPPSGTGAAEIAKALTPQVAPGSDGYTVGPQDVLDVSVFNVPELQKTVQIAATGTMAFPLVGEVQASGHTAREIEKDLAVKLGTKYLQKPQVSVMVKEYNSQRVVVDGAFIRPGTVPYQGRGTLLQYVANAGGLTPTADTNVIVFRKLEGKQSAAKFDLDDIRSGKTGDPDIKAGDIIVASTSASKEAFEKFLRVIPVAGVFAQVAAL